MMPDTPADQALQVEVVYAERESQRVCRLTLAAGATVADALAAVSSESGFGDTDLAHASVGVYGRVCEREQKLRDGDRVEIYRELAVDAKAARRRRAREQRGGS